MVSSRKQWRRLALGLMLTWALLFLALLSYFMESRVDEPHSSAPLSHADARRLASVQGNPRAIVVQQERATGAPDPSGSGGPRQDRNPQWVPSEEPPPVPRLGPEAYPDPRSPAAWSAFGARDEAADSAGATRELGGARGPRPEADGARRAGEEEEEEGGEDEGGEEAEEDRLPGTTTRRAEDSDDLEDYYFSKAKAVMQRLWRGSLSVSMLSPRLQRAMKDYLNSNKHGVAYRGRRRGQQSGRQVLCELKRRGRVQTVDGAEPPFSELGWAGLVPSARLTELYGSGFGSCAVVTSAGAILLSALGKEIDSHDAVLRFNAAPTEGYERDVGNKTTIRIINSQILANPKHLFNTSSLYKNVTLVAWDPAPYTVNLNKWFSSPDYNLFSPYVAHRKSFPDQPFYILHPRFIWQLWDVIQGNTLDNIQPNPPSSGFIGILLMMSLCEEVHVYEYIPSLRQTDLCHYHERYYDAACTLGAYHPLLYEKMLVQRMNQGSESDLKRKGKVTLPGFSTIHCDP